MNLASLSIRRPTFIAAIIVAMLVVGFIFMNRMSVDMFPDVNFPYISVTTIYPGAGPAELETLVSKPLEEQISSISGLKNVSSINQDGVSIVFGEFTLETDPKYSEQQVKDKIAQVRNKLPKDVLEPVVRRFDPSDAPIMSVSLSADLPPAKLFDLADTTVKNGFEQVRNVSSVDIIGGTKREIHVDLDRNKLKEHETSLSMVANRIGGNSQNVPIGKVSLGNKELSFRSMGEFRTLKQINDVIVNFYASDVPVTVSRLGAVTDTTEEVKTKGYLNGSPALLMNIYKQSATNTVDVSDNLQKRIARLNETMKSMPGNPVLRMVHDNARAIRINLKDIKVTIFEGILLAIIVVYLFLGNFRSTLITIMALPNSLIGSFIFMGISGFSVNMLTLMALSLAVGLLIDDAIVVRENIFRHIEEGEHPMNAAQAGTDEVMLAVIATTMTIIAVFLPVGFLQGMVGQFFKQFGLTIVFAMSISLFDALTVAPMLSAYFMSSAEESKQSKGRSRLSSLAHMPAEYFNVFYRWFEGLYVRVIRFTLRHKFAMLAGSFLVFVLSMGLVTKIPKTFMPANERGEFTVDLQAEPGTSLEQMDRYADEIYRIVKKEKVVELVSVSVGNANGESNVAQLYVKMIPVKQRKIKTSEFEQQLRGELAGYKQELNPLVNELGMVNGQGAPFNLLLIGDDLDVLVTQANSLIEKLKPIPGLVDLNINYKVGKPEFQVKMNPEKMVRLGVQSVTAGVELRGMVEGLLPAKYREGDMEYDIRVKLQEDQRNLSRDFGLVYVPNVNYQLVKLSNIADPVTTAGPAKIFRRNRSRYVMISGNTTGKGAIGDITSATKKVLAKNPLPPGVKYEFTGSSEQFEDLVKNMMIASGLSVIFIYFVLASLYESLVIPFTIMLALPLSTIGALIALFITGQPLNMMSMIGLIMLLGLATKNSILLIDYTQRLMRSGLSREEAVVKAGSVRLRPILMTSFALIAGMFPLALALTETGTFRQSMGIAVIGGILSSTFLTLIVIPAVFGYTDSFRMRSRKLFGRPQLREIDKVEG